MSSAFKTIDFLNDPTNNPLIGHHIHHQNNLSVSISNNNSYFESDFLHLNHSSNSVNGILSRDECDSPKKKKFRQNESPFLIPSLLSIDNNSFNNNNNDDSSSFSNMIKLNNSVNNFKIPSPNSFSYSPPTINQQQQQILPNIPNFLLSYSFDYDSNINLFKNSPIDENDSQVNYNFQLHNSNNSCIINNNLNNSLNYINNNGSSNCDEQSSDTTTITPQESNSPLSSSNDIIEDKIVNNDQQINQVDENQIKNDNHNNNNNIKPSFIYSIDQQPQISKELVYETNSQTSSAIADHDSFDNESLEGGSSIEGDDEEEEDDHWNPLIFIKQLPIGMIESIAPRPKLPPKDQFAHKITLVLDLDETLVHCSTEPIDEPHLTFPVTFNNVEYQVFAKKRPFFEEFLLQMSNHFELIIFTASQEIYARTLLDIIDPNNRITHRLYRDSCLFLKGNYLKDLRVLNRDLNHVIIIDNSPQSFGFHIENGIPIESWFEDENDKELLGLVPFLESLKTVDDVRPVIREKFWKGIYNPLG